MPKGKQHIIEPLQFVFEESTVQPTKPTLWERTNSFFSGIPHWMLVTSALLMGSATGIAIGVGAVYEAFLATVTPATMSGLLSPNQALFANALLIPTLVFGFVTWCATYVMPMLKAVNSARTRASSSYPHLFDTYQVINKVWKDIDLIDISNDEKLEMIHRLLIRRLNVQVNYGKASGERLVTSIQTAYGNKKSDVIHTPEKGNFIPAIVVTPEIEASLMAINAIDTAKTKKTTKINFAHAPSKDHDGIFKSISKSPLFEDTFYLECQKNVTQIHNDKSNSIDIDTFYLHQLSNLYTNMVGYRHTLEDPSHTAPIGQARAIVDQQASYYSQETCDKWLIDDYNATCNDLICKNEYNSETIDRVEDAKKSFLAKCPELNAASLKNNLPSLITQFANINAVFINSSGVAMGLVVAFNMMFMPTAGYAASAGPMLLTVLGLGWAAGLACAWFLTKQSMQDSFGRMFRKYTDPTLAPSTNRLFVEKTLTDVRRNKGESMWTWLSLPKSKAVSVIRDIMIVGFSLGSSLYNYAAGVKFAVLASHLFRFFRSSTPTNALLNLSSLDGEFNSPPKFAGYFGQIAAVTTFFASSGLLWSAVKQPRIQKDSQNNTLVKNTLFYTIFSFSVLGQAYLHAVNTFCPHGLPALLASFGMPAAYVLPTTYALAATVVPGLLICAKLLSDNTQEMLDWMLPNSSTVVANPQKSHAKASDSFSFAKLAKYVFGSGSEASVNEPHKGIGSSHA